MAEIKRTVRPRRSVKYPVQELGGTYNIRGESNTVMLKFNPAASKIFKAARLLSYPPSIAKSYYICVLFG
jgi:hypothetical protein